LGDPADGDCVVVTAHAAEGESGGDAGSTVDGHAGSASAVGEGADVTGRTRALLHFVPWGRRGLSLDVMLPDPAADHGLNEFLIVSAVRAAPRLGVERISLNFAFFRSALERGERLGAGPAVRAYRRVLVFLSRWFQIESLYRFNAKFGPEWQPRYIC